MSDPAAASEDRHGRDGSEIDSGDAINTRAGQTSRPGESQGSGPVDRAILIAQLDAAFDASPVGLVLIEVGIDDSVAPLSVGDVEQTGADLAACIAGQAEQGDTTVTTGTFGWALIRTAISAPAEADGLGYRIHKALTEPAIVGDRKMSNRAAIGVVTSLSGDTGEHLLRYAEHALGDAKTLGGDRVVIFDDEDRSLLLP